MGNPMSPIAPLRNQLLQSLSAAELETLRPHLELTDMVRETVVIEAGARQTHVYLPHSGVISMTVSLSDGHSVEVAIIGRESIFGAAAALGSEISLSDAVVLLPGTASILNVAHLRAVADRNAAFRTTLIRHEQALLMQAQQSAPCNAAHSVEARLSRWLLRLRDLYDGESLPLTQEFLARMIGVQRNAVSIVAHALQQAGTIRYSRGHIHIADVEALRDTSCECYQMVKSQCDRLLKRSD
jgi:CRP-like cAMP-binding protein